MKDAASELYDARSKSMLRNTDPYAIAALLLVIAPFFGVWLLPILIPVTASMAVLLSIVSLVRLSRSEKYQGKRMAISSLVLGVLQLLALIVVIAHLEPRFLLGP